ncbi:acyltransferase family protein [Flavobacterium sp.]|uniref:acyltransferase family protein n=1 Tax=Flavobacterium sp. TaxID=239 RepID=UPI002B9C7FD1|nr:acyltransferase family protein [Flavobacterium sp.]HSD06046.1 acyltransferase family protein [Flavobacterium sp.]
METVNRSISADLIKTISIFGAVFIHSFGILCNLSNFSIDITHMFRFGVPAFLVLWAYFFETSYNRKNKSERFTYLTQRFTHLFKVYIIWSAVYFIAIANWDVSFLKNITMYFAGFGFSGQYFLIILFQLLLVHPLLRYLYFNKTLRIITILIIAVLYILYGYFEFLLPNILLKIGERAFLFWIPSVFVGIAMVHGKMIKIPLVMAVSILLIPLESSILHQFNYHHFNHITPIVLISSILFCVSIMQKEHLIKTKLKKVSHRVLTYIATHTIVIFILNPMIIVFLLKFNFFNYFHFSYLENLIAGSVMTIIITFFCLAVGEFFQKIGLEKIVF